VAAVVLEDMIMLEGHIDHQGVRALLEYESTRLAVSIHVRHIDLDWDATDRRDVIEVLVHSGPRRLDFGLHVDGQVHRLHVPVWLPPDDVPLFGPLDEHGQVQPLVSLLGYHVAIHVPPAALDGLAVKVLGRALEAALPMAKAVFEEEVLDKETDRYVALKATAATERLESSRQELRTSEVAIRRLEDDLRLQYRHLTRAREEVVLLEAHTLPAIKRRARSEITRLRGMVPLALQAVKVEGDRLMVTTHPVDINHDGIGYEMGRYCLTIDIRTRQIRIRALDREVRGYGHPHVNSGGEPCLGSMASPVADMLARQDYFALVVGLQEYLRSYNPASPYLELEHWNPDFSDSRRWDDCLEDASISDCVECSDSDCLYWDSRHDRCWEAVDELTDCIRCEACNWAEDARRLCREQHSPQECFDCDTTACDYAGDEDVCHGAHAGAACPNCNHEHCSHHPGDGEEEEG